MGRSTRWTQVWEDHVLGCDRVGTCKQRHLQALSLLAAGRRLPRSLANLGALADKEAWGVEPFEEKRDTHLFTRR